MPSLLPHRFLFRCAATVRHQARLPRSGKSLLALPPECRLPDLGGLDGQAPFGELRAGWNERGVGFSVEVRGKRFPAESDPRTPETTDGLQLWIDTRDTQTIHRASRFCHHFFFLPCCGPGGAPQAGQLPLARARESAPLAPEGSLGVWSRRTRDGYLLECWLSAEALHGYDPEVQPRLGFYYALRDAELGEQTWSVGAEFPYAFDPSLWGTLELAP